MTIIIKRGRCIKQERKFRAIYMALWNKEDVLTFTENKLVLLFEPVIFKVSIWSTSRDFDWFQDFTAKRENMRSARSQRGLLLRTTCCVTPSTEESSALTRVQKSQPKQANCIAIVAQSQPALLLGPRELRGAHSQAGTSTTSGTTTTHKHVLKYTSKLALKHLNTITHRYTWSETPKTLY